MYKSTIIGTDQNIKVGINIKQMIRNPYLISFPAQLNFLNLSENKGISLTSSRDMTTITGMITPGLSKLRIRSCCQPIVSEYCHKSSGNAQKKIVLAGVGTPMKDSDCLVSMLNFANLNIEKNGISKAQSGIQDIPESDPACSVQLLKE